MIFDSPPEGFNPRFEVASCFVELTGKLLLLHRLPHKPEGGTWGLPAGKVDAGETLSEAMARELVQETGIRAVSEYLESVFVRYSAYDFIYCLHRLVLETRPELAINSAEHDDYAWETPEDALNRELIPDLGACIKRHYNT